MLKLNNLNIVCDYCESANASKHLIRKNKNENKVVYRCNRCKKIFTPDKDFKRMRYSKEIIIDALNLFHEGYSFGNIRKLISKIYNIEIERSTFFRWIKKYSKI